METSLKGTGYSFRDGWVVGFAWPSIRTEYSSNLLRISTMRLKTLSLLSIVLGSMSPKSPASGPKVMDETLTLMAPGGVPPACFSISTE